MASVDRINGLTGNLGIKAPVRCATTTNITLSGLQTIDGITVVANDRVLVKDQTDATENGVYLVSSSAWQREPDFDGNRDVVKGTLVRVNEGTIAAGRAYAVTTSDPIIIDTSSLSFTASVAGTDLGTAAYEDIGTSGANIGLLNANKTDSGNNTFSGNNTYSGESNFTGEATFAANPYIENTSPTLFFKDTNSPTDTDLSTISGNGGLFRIFFALTDGTLGTAIMSVTRDGAAKQNADVITFGGNSAVFPGNLDVGSLSFNGNASKIDLVLYATASLNFGSINAGASEDLTITVTGAVTTDKATLFLPAAANSGIVWTAIVTSSNTVTVRATNASTLAINPSTMTFGVKVERMV